MNKIVTLETSKMKEKYDEFANLVGPVKVAHNTHLDLQLRYSLKKIFLEISSQKIPVLEWYFFPFLLSAVISTAVIVMENDF